MLCPFFIQSGCANTSKYCFQVIAERLSEEEIGGLKELFKVIDTDNSGTITFEELKEGLRSMGSNLVESEIKSLMEAVGRLFLLLLLLLLLLILLISENVFLVLFQISS